MRTKTLLAGVTVLCSVSPGLSYAADAEGAGARIETVVVTAQKRAEDIQQVPIAITALTSEDLETRGITSFEGVAQSSPTIAFEPSFYSPSTLVMFMRGQGNNTDNPQVITSEGSVGLYEDGFFIARPNAATFDMADIDRVEILRGPQGTLYGFNTTGGAVNIISKKPSGEFGIKQTLDFGSRNLFRSLTAIDLPKWHDLSAKVTLLRSAIDGYVKNIGSSRDWGYQRQVAGRLQLHWDATSAVQADYFIERGDLDDTGLYSQSPLAEGGTAPVNGVTYTYSNADRPAERGWRPLDVPLSRAKFWGQGLTLSWDVTSELTVRSLTGTRQLDSRPAYNTNFAGLIAPDPAVAPVNQDSVEHYRDHQFSQEFQFIGTALDEQIHYVGGLYYFREAGTGDFSGTYTDFFFGITSHTDSEAKSRAAYGQISWQPDLFNRRLELTAGGRYTKDTRDVDNTGTFFLVGGPTFPNAPKPPVRASFNRFTPSFVANYKWSEEVGTYAKVAKGYRSGGAFFGGSQIGNEYAPEDLTSYEAGLKSYWFDRRMRLNLAAFHNKFKDMQLVFNSDPSSVGVTSIYNAGSATIEGFEAEMLLSPTDDLSFSINYAYLDAKLDRILVRAGTIYDPAVNSLSPYNVGDNIQNLFTMPYAPRNSIDAAVDYRLVRWSNGGLSAHVDYRWQDKLFQSATAGPNVANRDLARLPGRGYLNARLTLDTELAHGDHVSVSLWGKNITDREYVVAQTAQGTNVAAPGFAAGYNGGYGHTWAAPVSHGISLSYDYR